VVSVLGSGAEGPRFKLKFRKNFLMEVPLFLQIPEFAKNAVYEWSKEAFMPKFRSIRPAVSIEHRLATDRQTDRHRAIASAALARMASRG